MRDYRKFEIWKKSVVIAKDIYLLSEKFPNSENMD